MKFKTPFILAHRGVSSIAPENTMPAFKKAKQFGVGVELDIHLCKSGELVVIHDYEINRTARNLNSTKISKKLEVEDLTLSQLRKYDFGIWFDKKFAGTKISTLKEVLDLNLSIVNIEIKVAKGKPYKEVSIALAEFLNSYSKTKSVDNVFVSSFHPFALKTFKRELKVEIPTGLLYSNLPEVPKYLHYGLGRFLFNPDFLQAYYKDIILKNNLTGKIPYIAWAVEDPKIARELVSKGVIGITTSHPQDMLNLIKE